MPAHTLHNPFVQKSHPYERYRIRFGADFAKGILTQVNLLDGALKTPYIKQLSTMLTMISNNVAVGFTFRELAQTNKAFVAIPTQNPMYVNASLVWKKNSYPFGCMEKFKKYVEDKNPFDAIR